MTLSPTHVIRKRPNWRSRSCRPFAAHLTFSLTFLSLSLSLASSRSLPLSRFLSRGMHFAVLLRQVPLAASTAHTILATTFCLLVVYSHSCRVTNGSFSRTNDVLYFTHSATMRAFVRELKLVRQFARRHRMSPALISPECRTRQGDSQSCLFGECCDG